MPEECIIAYIANSKVKFDDLDKESKDELLREICWRIEKLEG